MPRSHAPVAFLTLAVASAALLAQDPPRHEVEVRGVVVDEHGKPVAKATVLGDGSLQAPRFSTSYTQNAVTDAKGAFTFKFALIAEKQYFALRLRARQEQSAFTAEGVVVRGEALDKPVRLTVSPKHAKAVSVRILDEEKRPVPGAKVTARHRPAAPPPFGLSSGTPVKWPTGVAKGTDGEGRFTSARCLDPDGDYQLLVEADGFLETTCLWKKVGKEDEVAFGDLVVTRLRELKGVVVDTKGQPVAGAKVLRTDDRRRDEATTDAAGRFAVKTSSVPPAFVFVHADGFRFHGQRWDKADEVRIVLTRRDEPAKGKMTVLPPVLPLAKRKALAEKLLAPTLEQTLTKGTDDQRYRLLKTLGQMDPGRLLAELERRPLKDPWFDGYVRSEAVRALRGDMAEAKAVAESIKDPGFRARCYVELEGSLPEGRKADRLACLNQALVASRAVTANDHRILNLAQVARRLHHLGEKDRAAKLLREGHDVAKELPTAGWSGYARGAFAEDLALIDRPGALALMKDLKDPYEYVRHHANLAMRVAAADPAEAERLLELVESAQKQRGRGAAAVRVCHRMAPIDLKRAERLARGIRDDHTRARAFAVMALSLAKSKPTEALALLDESYLILAQVVFSGRDHFNNYSNAAALAGLSLPIAEQIDPALVPEFFWRTVALHPPAPANDPEDGHGFRAAAIGSVALPLARYDRDVARALLGKAKPPRTDLGYQIVNYFNALAFVDPAKAVALVERGPASPNSSGMRDAVVAMLLADGPAAIDRAVHRMMTQWYVDDEDL